MLIPLKWLREYVDITLPVAELAWKLTLSSAEVEGVEYLYDWDEKVRVGEVLRVEPHPNADRLHLPTVFTPPPSPPAPAPRPSSAARPTSPPGSASPSAKWGRC